MRILFFILITFSIIACSKDNDTNVPPPPIDSLKAGWTKMKLETSATINDIFFINNTTGYAVAGSEIFRSTDGGNQWSKVYQSENNFSNIAMGSVNNAVFTSYSRIVFTNNGGTSFDSVQLASYVDDAFFVSESTAYAVGDKAWKTTNAGKNWTNVSTFNPAGNDNIRAVFFLDEQTGWATGGSGFFKTTNGGVTWDNAPGPYAGFGRNIGNISFVNATIGYITSGSNEVYKTLDGGTSFTKIFDTYRSSYHDIQFVDSQTGYITDGIYILKTINAGQTWTKEVVLAQGELVECHFTDASHGWAAGYNGWILKYER